MKKASSTAVYHGEQPSSFAHTDDRSRQDIRKMSENSTSNRRYSPTTPTQYRRADDPVDTLSRSYLDKSERRSSEYNLAYETLRKEIEKSYSVMHEAISRLQQDVSESRTVLNNKVNDIEKQDVSRIRDKNLLGVVEIDDQPMSDGTIESDFIFGNIHIISFACHLALAFLSLRMW